MEHPTDTPHTTSSRHWWLVGIVLVAAFAVVWVLATLNTATPARAAQTGVPIAIIPMAEGDAAPSSMRDLAVPTRAPTAAIRLLPSPTFTPSPTLIPEATTRTRVNLRAGPGLNQAVLRVLAQGARVTVLVQNPSADWLQVRTAEGQIGWVSAELLAPNTNPTPRPVSTVSIPATPISQPVAVRTPSPVPPRSTSGNSRVTAIGDSIMLAANAELAKRLDVDLDAALGRQVGNGIELLRTRRDAGKLGSTVIIHLGNNGTFTRGQFDEMMALTGGVRRVIWVNLKVPRAWQVANNAVIAEGVNRYPNARLVDWNSASANHAEYFWSDGLHLRPEGVQVYAALITAAVNAP